VFDELLDDELENVEDDAGAVIGIDLGTTNSVVARAQAGVPRVLRDLERRTLHPSVVAWLPSGERLIGAEAKPRRVIDPENTVYSVKRLIGQPFGSERVQEALRVVPYRVKEGEQQELLVLTREGDMPVPQISAYVLGHIKEIAEREMGKPVTHCVVTVPANFSDGQRAATRRAASLAGMEVLRILNEPTAAAIAYGRDRPLHQRIAIFDLGGGTFDVTVLAVRGNLYEVMATGGDPFLGGDDFDRQIAHTLARQFLQQHRLDAEKDPVALARLMAAAEQMKIRLSEELAVEGKLREIAYGAGGAPLDLSFSMERHEFEALISPIIDRAIVTAENVLREAGLLPNQIDEVILVGGSTRIPMVQERVRACFQQEPRCELNPMEVVAMGAAIQAETLFLGDRVPDAPVLFDVAPHSLRVGTVGGFTKTLIAKNSTIPAEGTSTFFTARDNQDTVLLKICQGEEERVDGNAPLGELVLQGIPPGPRGTISIDVAFTIDADGILHVAAREAQTGAATQATLATVGLKEQR
jgi:molecular chaperone DnaK